MVESYHQVADDSFPRFARAGDRKMAKREVENDRWWAVRSIDSTRPLPASLTDFDIYIYIYTLSYFNNVKYIYIYKLTEIIL